MKIIIPMSGVGQRLLDAGYNDPKPLIAVDGKPIVEHVVNMFSPEDEFVFICSNDHLENTELASVLKSVVPNARIIGIEPYKLGPVYATTFAFQYIEDDEPVIVCYCDFYEWWNYEDFKKTVEKNGCDAAVTAYKGFHPHMLGPGLYASMRVDNNNWMLECREKHSFTENKMDSFQQSGKFYFAKGSILKRYFGDLIDKKFQVNGEYYVSTVTQLLVEAGLNVYIYSVSYFLQWGTPQDLGDYNKWSGLFRNNNAIIDNSWDENTKNTFNYWKRFFALCQWHPYGKISTAKIKGILLDFDNTLYNKDVCNIYAKSELIGKISDDNNIDAEDTRKAYETSRENVKKLLENTGPSDSRLLYIQKTLELLHVKNYISKSVVYEEFFWQKFFEKMRLFDGVIDFLRYMAKNKIKVCIVSDMTTKMQMVKIDYLGIENYIDFLVTSEEVGEKKPSTRIFSIALEKMNMHPADVIVIGDDEKRDIMGATTLGISAIKSTPEFFRECRFVEIFKNL